MSAATWLAYLLPLSYFALVMWLQPAAYLGDPAGERWLGRLFYDDYDWAAVSLRVLNAERGRIPGALADPCIQPQNVRDFPASAAGSHQYQQRYFLEYPNFVVSLFRRAFWLVPGMRSRPIPPAILDGCQDDFLNYRAVTPADLEIWRGFRHLIMTFEAATFICLLMVIAVLRRGYLPDGSLAVPGILLLLPAFLYFSLNRFDIVPTLLMALSLFCLARGRLTLSAILLALGAMVKVYPVLLTPLFVRYLLGNRRNATKWSVAFGATVVLAMGWSIMSVGWPATLGTSFRGDWSPTPSMARLFRASLVLEIGDGCGWLSCW
jgi:hypothetical protein